MSPADSFIAAAESTTPADHDLALDLPLRDIQLIEASAGTGKTYTLAGIYTRLIVEQRLSVREVLVVTFTKAATEELKSRLRARLVLCAEVAAGMHADEQTPKPDLLQSRRLVAAALQVELAEALQVRLRLASLELDSAQISTIHGFCQRALREHTLDALARADGDLVASDRDLIETIAGDIWRARAVTADTAGFAAFARVVGGARGFTRVLPRLIATRTELLPLPQLDADAARAAIHAASLAAAALGAVWRQHATAAFSALLAHANAGHVNASNYAPKRIQQDAEIVAAAFADRGLPDLDLLARYTTSALSSSKCIKKNKSPLPTQTFFDALERALGVLQHALHAERQLGLHLLRESILSAGQRLDALKRATRRFSYDDLIAHLHDALSSAHGRQLARSLREQYPVALVDEFQDTDAAQFAIFSAIYAGDDATQPTSASTALILIGDPKQAIYRFRGGDVHTYLAARQRAAGVHRLSENFRSTPGYLRALDHLYTFAGAGAFADPRIAFEPVSAAGEKTDADLLIDGVPATPLTFWLASEAASNKLDATERLAAGCASTIFDLLQRARSGAAMIRAAAPGGSVMRELKTSDMAVLVATNDEALAIQMALSARNIPSVALSKRSVFASEEARELHLLLDALIEFDEPRLRAALATLIMGQSLADFAAFRSAPLRWSQTLRWLSELRQTWFERGVLAMLENVFERRAASLLAQRDGERRLTNWLQLADLTQAASSQVVAQRGVADWLAQRIARADNDREDEQLRLESDAERVQIRTIHASKGLQYGIVFLPFASLRRQESHHYPRPLSCRSEHGNAATYLISNKDAADTPAAIQARTDETADDQAERLRVLYVALTRACYACYIGTGIFGKGKPPGLLHLLGVHEGSDAARDLAQRLNTLSDISRYANARSCIAVVALPEPDTTRWRDVGTVVLAAERITTRRLHELRRSYSFSGLSAGGRDAVQSVQPVTIEERAGLDDEPAAADRPNSALIDLPTSLRGPRFGSAFHEILEHADFAAWRDWRASAPPAGQRDLIDTILRRHALIDESAAANPIRHAVTELISATLNAPLPFGARLVDLRRDEMRAELPFHFAIDDSDASAWLAQMQKFGYLTERRRFAVDGQRLAGLMTGVLDLVVLRGGRWWVIDYKTNLLGANRLDYAPAHLAQAVRECEYDLQYLIYLVALHRWLKSRRGDEYDYARDIGGALYLFVRGLDAGGVNGVHWDCPPHDLIEALDGLLAACAGGKR